MTTPPPIPQVPPPQPKKSGCLRGFVILKWLLVGGVIVVLIIRMIVGPPASPSTSPAASATSAPSTASATPATSTSAPFTPLATSVATPQESDISWREVDSIYNLRSKQTNLQKDELWKRFKGKRVTWNGKVSAVEEGLLGGLTLQVKMNPDTLTSDVLITLKESEKPKALQFHEGDRVRFTGILSDWGSLMPITLDDGEIIK